MLKHLSQVEAENRIWENVLTAFLGINWNLWYYVILFLGTGSVHKRLHTCVLYMYTQLYIYIYTLSWELTTFWHFWRWFPFSKVGYVNSLQIHLYIYIYIWIGYMYSMHVHIYIYTHILVILSRSHLIIIESVLLLPIIFGMWKRFHLILRSFGLQRVGASAGGTTWMSTSFQWSNGERPVSKLEQDGKMWLWWI